MNTFYSYEKMPDSLAKLQLTENQMRDLEKTEWAVTEKVHGANFSFSMEGDQLIYGKRKEVLAWQDDFFGYQLVAKKLEFSIRKLFQAVKSTYQYDKCTIYGELFGGDYPHPDVAKDDRVQAIQTGVYYSPTIEFYAFDIAIEHNGNRFYLDYQSAIQYFESCNVFFAKPLVIGSLTEALNYNLNFQSIISQWLGLPALNQDNLAEGIVIKPMKSIQLETKKGSIRPIIKRKHERFNEIKFHQVQKWSYIPSDSSLEDQLDFLLPDLQALVNANRLQNTFSKIGQIDPDNKTRMEAIKQLFLEDVFDSFEEEQGDILNMIPNEQVMWLKSRIALDIDLCIQQYLATQGFSY